MRKIDFSIRKFNEMIFIDCKNTCKNTPMDLNSTKFNKKFHGWGIKSIKKIVEQNAGDISFNYLNEQFEVTIVFYL